MTLKENKTGKGKKASHSSVFIGIMYVFYKISVKLHVKNASINYVTAESLDLIKTFIWIMFM